MRPLKCIKFWKGLEFRTFLLYIGPVILKDYLPNDVYEHFLMLSYYHIHVSKFSSYPFESIQHQIKNFKRHGNKPLEQVAKRLMEVSKLRRNANN